jgi:hypothetical protein
MDEHTARKWAKAHGVDVDDKAIRNWLEYFKAREGQPTVAWVENAADRTVIGYLRRTEMIERRGYSSNGVSAFYYLTDKGNDALARLNGN